ncbi:hypothetical protein LDFHOB_00570 [Candidatus Electronema aureum]
MESSKIRALTIKCLHEAVLEMMSFEWHEEVAKLPTAKRKKVSLLVLDCFNWKVKLENAQLEAILAQLEENKEALEAGTKKVNEALKNLKQVKDVLDATSSLLNVVARVVV